MQMCSANRLERIVGVVKPAVKKIHSDSDDVSVAGIAKYFFARTDDLLEIKPSCLQISGKTMKM